MSDLHYQMINAVTKYDISKAKRDEKAGRLVNIYALGHYFTAVENVERHVKTGDDLRNALVNCFSGSLLKAVMRAVKLEPPTSSELQGLYVRLQELPDVDL